MFARKREQSPLSRKDMIRSAEDGGSSYAYRSSENARKTADDKKATTELELQMSTSEPRETARDMVVKRRASSRR